MKNLLMGNGVNVQFGGSEFNNKNIVLRTLLYFEDESFPKHIIMSDPIDGKAYIGFLFLEIKHLLEGELDRYANCNAEREAIQVFKKQYGDRKSLKITDIGFEDYYLVHDLLCHKLNIDNPEMYNVREALKLCFLSAIYDKGKVNEVYKRYPSKFVEKLKEYDTIFTTNYDQNVELACGKSAYHIHGDFETRSEVYNPESFRNKLSDSPCKEYVIDENYSYLYSTALTTYSGSYKQYTMTQHTLANEAIEKMAKAYINDDTVRSTVHSWEKERNQLVKNLGESIELKVANSELKFQELYPVQELKNMEGKLDIIGLSPYNDYHLFEIINDNEKVQEVCFYYFNETECDIINTVLSKKILLFEEVKKLWKELR